MNTFVLEIWYDEGQACTFYSVNKNTDTPESSPSETDKFFDNFTAPGHPLAPKALELFRLITQSIGNKYGATDDFFDRSENHAQALPPLPKRGVEEIKQLGARFPLRLFCYRVTAQIVVLFNGGVKQAQTLQQNPQLSIKFFEAQSFTKKLIAALLNKEITISPDGRYLVDDNQYTSIIL